MKITEFIKKIEKIKDKDDSYIIFVRDYEGDFFQLEEIEIGEEDIYDTNQQGSKTVKSVRLL